MRICAKCFEAVPEGDLAAECGACAAERRWAERQRAWWSVDFFRTIGALTPEEAELYLDRVLAEPRRASA